MFKQVSVFLQNSKGRIYEVLSAISRGNVNIRSLSIADSNDFGVLRLIVDDYKRAVNVLQQSEFMYDVTDVIALKVDDKPGSLADSLKLLKEECIDVDYIYAFIGKIDTNAFVIIRVEDPTKAVEVLKRGGAFVLEDDVLDSNK